MKTKVCSRCGEEKPITEFYRRSASPDGLNAACKECVRQAAAERRRKQHATKVLEEAQKADARKERNLQRLYGISLDDYEQMFYAQDRRCAICRRPADDFQRDLAVDHNHVTGEVRGLLCPDCNRGLGGFQDDVNLLRKAIKYLQKQSAQQ
jgi:NMD protein affecting ribosome stability and mRNA decay